MDEESQSSTTMEKALPHHVENSVGVSSGSMTPKDSAFPVEENHVEHKQQAPEPQQPPEKQQDEDPSQEQSQQPSPGKMPRIPQHGVCRVWLPLEFGRGFSAIRVQGTVGQAKAEVLRKLESHGKAGLLLGILLLPHFHYIFSQLIHLLCVPLLCFFIPAIHSQTPNQTPSLRSPAPQTRPIVSPMTKNCQLPCLAPVLDRLPLLLALPLQVAVDPLTSCI